MRRLNPLCRMATLIGLTLALIACTGVTYNPSTFDFQIDKERVADSSIKTVVIAHVNLGVDSRNYLEKEAPRIDATVTKYLKDNGFKVLPQREFTQHWNTATRAFGNPVDPTSGKINTKTFAQIMHNVRDQMSKNSKLDAFIFTDILEFQVPFSGGLKHLARWDGVSRKPSL
jgi:hypothetical protein